MARRVNDYYPTPTALTKALLKRVPISGNVLEPCAADGQIVRPLKEAGCQVWTNDIDPAYFCDWNLDAATSMYRNHEGQIIPTPFWGYGGGGRYEFDWIVTNPPFKEGINILSLAYEVACVGVAFLLRLSFLEPTEGRGEWLQAHKDNMAHLFIFGQPRPSFTGNGRHDSVTTAWMVWKKEHSGGTRVEFITGWKDDD